LRTSKLLFKHLKTSDDLWMFKKVNDSREFICEAKQNHSSQRIETEFWWILFDAFEIVLFRHNRRNRAFSQEVVRLMTCFASWLWHSDSRTDETDQSGKHPSPDRVKHRSTHNCFSSKSNQPFLKTVFSIHCISNHPFMLRFVEQLSVQIKILFNFHRGRLCAFVINLFIPPYLSLSPWDTRHSSSNSRSTFQVIISFVNSNTWRAFWRTAVFSAAFSIRDRQRLPRILQFVGRTAFKSNQMADPPYRRSWRGDPFSLSAANSNLSLPGRSRIHKGEDWITFENKFPSKNGESFTKRTSD
jgi:hypothetical protein